MSSGSEAGRVRPEGRPPGRRLLHRRPPKSSSGRFGFRTVATTLRGSRSASRNSWAAILSDGTNAWASRTYDIDPIVDRVGAGDAFSGALIYGLLSGWDEQAVVDFATAASCLKHGIPGDFNQVERGRGERTGRRRRIRSRASAEVVLGPEQLGMPRRDVGRDASGSRSSAHEPRRRRPPHRHRGSRAAIARCCRNISSKVVAGGSSS